MLENLAIALGVGISDLFVKKETAIKDMPVSHTLKKMLSIPDEVYEMASRLEGAHKKRAWEGIEGILSGAIAAQEEEVKNRSHSS